MAITDYATLKTTVADYLHRSDLSDDVISTFVQLGEARLNRKLRLIQQENTDDVTLTAGNDYAALPSGWIETIDLIYSSDKRELQAQNIKSLNSQRSYDNSTSRPYLYAIFGGRIEFEIIADQTYTLSMDYFKGWDIATDDTNWLLTNAPDAYLYSALLEAKAYIKNMQDMTIWSQGLQTAVDDLNNLDSRTRRNATVRMDGALVRTSKFDINRGY